MLVVPSISPEVISSQMAQYRSLMNSLIHEKPGGDINDKRDRTMALAMKILLIGYPSDERDEEFEIDIKNRIKELCNLKVGRKLIKALAKILEAPKIQGKHIHPYIPIRLAYMDDSIGYIGQDEYCSQYKYAELTKASRFKFQYRVMKDNSPYISKEYPLLIALAHELIHALHHYSASPIFDLDNDPDQLLLESMTDPEEQHTITGYNYHLFSKKGKFLNKVDVICENAFLLALGLPARTSHAEALGLSDLEGEIPNVEESYYEWLETQLKQKIANLS